MKLKKDWKRIVVTLLLFSVGISYVLTAFIVRMKNKFKNELFDVLKQPSYIYEQVMSDENLKIIVLFIPLILLAGGMYLLRKNIFDLDYKNASEFGVKGTARWGTITEYLGSVFAKKSKYTTDNLQQNLNMDDGIIVGKIPNKKQALTIPESTDLNTRNVLVHAPSGGGKGQSYVITNLINIKNDNMIVIDPKGENYELTHQLKRDQGYQVYNVDFMDLDQSRYNPLDYVKNDEDANNIAHIMMVNSSSSDDGTDFFMSRAQSILAGLISYVKALYPPEKANMSTLLEVYNEKVADEATCKAWLKNIDDDNPAKPALLGALQSLKTDTRASVMGSFDDIVATFIQKRVREMTKVSDFNFRDFQNKKTVVYVKIKTPYNDKQSLTSMFFSQMIDMFFILGNEQKSDTKLPIPVHFMFDEFANIGKIPNYDKTLAFCRGYNLYMHTIVQDMSQFRQKTMYGEEETKTILANHSAKLLLKMGEKDNAEYWEAYLGNKTAKYKSESINVSKSGKSSSFSDVYEEVPLMPANELLKMDENKAVLVLTGYDPLFIDKAWQFKLFAGLLTNSNREYCYNETRELLGYTTPVHEDTEEKADNLYIFENYRLSQSQANISAHVSDEINQIISDVDKDHFHQEKEEKHQKEEQTENAKKDMLDAIEDESNRERQEYEENIAAIEQVKNYFESEKEQDYDVNDLMKSL